MDIDELNETLIKASNLGNVDKVLECLNLGADVNFVDDCDPYDSSALQNASAVGNVEMVQLLLERGANIHHELGNDCAI